MKTDLFCSVCGGASFEQSPVLWPGLVAEWQLSSAERDYVDQQQGRRCRTCGANLRVMALGNAIRSARGIIPPLRQAVTRGELDTLRILDCNGAEGISSVLSYLPGYQRADYPEHDMRSLSFASGMFDLVIHSDTLEHIEHPIRALEECRRVLRADGHLCFTVPIIVGRMTRSRVGLAPSYHGAAGARMEDYLVHTEFGADAWTFLHLAGFDRVTIHHVLFPAALALTASMAPALRGTVAAPDDRPEQT
jgi:SAM-dependent methyltransferase